MSKTITVDCEVYSNYFLAQFKHHESGKVIYVEQYNDSELDKAKLTRLMQNNLTIGFNSNNYDLPVIMYALQGVSNAQIKKLSDEIVTGEGSVWQTLKKYGLQIPREWNHIDIKDPSPGVMVSLKTYGGRLNAPKLQDLPIEPSAIITPEQAIELRNYCINDLDTTWLLYENVKHEIDLRESMSQELGVDLRSKGGAQVAKEYFVKKLGLNRVKPTQYKACHVIKYKAPSFISFKTDILKQTLADVAQADYKLKASGHIELPKAVERAIPFDGAKYKLGIGGLHSQEKAQTVEQNNEYALDMRDVTSFYPSIILGEGLYPKALGKKFLDIYRDVFKTRVDAKHSGDKYTANSLKLVLNSSFGLFGNKYSPLYAPELLLTVTLTGQLSLLMLIEMLSEIGVKTVSANTDGVAIYYPRHLAAEVEAVCFDWELTTGYGLETEVYKGIYSASVNTYLGLEPSGSFKTKGLFADSPLTSNPQFNVCVDAVKAYIKDNIPIEQTIAQCRDITRFLSIRSVRGGAMWRGEYLGKVVRWYWSTDGEPITYKTNDNKVPKSDASTPLMDLPNTMPHNVDLARYISEAYKILEDISYVRA